MNRIGRFFALTSLLLFLSFLLPLVGSSPIWAQSSFVDLLTIEGEINPGMAGYVTRSIERAVEDGAVCVIIQMDTPGGLMTAMDEIVRAISNAELPVIVYVSPQGARAASAGVYITYASHVAAMAPGTHLGAATPVTTGGGEEDAGDMLERQLRKIEEDALAQLRAFAEERGRNAEWAERAVLEAASATAKEALELDIVELIAVDLDDLLAQLDGRRITLASGRSVPLETADAFVRTRPMNLVDRLLHLITKVEVAYFLLSIGGLGLWIEFSKPGVQLPGVLGGVCIFLGLYGLGTLSVNWAGVLLILFAFVLFGFDIFAPTHLVLTTGGIAAFVAGSLLLFQASPDPYLRIPPGMIAAISGSIALIVGAILFAVIRGHRRPIVSGQEALIGAIGTARKTLDPDGLIHTQGALWQARSEEGTIERGEEVEIVGLEGLRLYVRRRSPPTGERTETRV
jgi:membrane-bound serine protease (ClpP class)